MDHIHPKLREDYDRWMEQIGDERLDPKCLITVDDVMRAHYLLVDRFMNEGEPIAVPGPRSIQLLMSALGRQATGYDGRFKYKSDLEVCATLFYGLIKDHPFHDGNKRTALLIALYHLLKIRRTPISKQREFEKLAVNTAANCLNKYSQYTKFQNADDPEVMFVADFLHRHTRELDSSLPVITYRELDKVLRRYGYALEDQSGGYIDVVRWKKERYGLFPRKTRIVRKWILKIGFPRWSAQVNCKALNSVLNRTGLTTENGYDSKVVFQDADSLDALIDTYRGPLKRLRDK